MAKCREPPPPHSTMLILSYLCKAFERQTAQTILSDKFPCKCEVTSTRHIEGVEVTTQRALSFKSRRKNSTDTNSVLYRASVGTHNFKLRVNNRMKAFKKKVCVKKSFFIRAAIIASLSEEKQFCCSQILKGQNAQDSFSQKQNNLFSSARFFIS